MTTHNIKKFKNTKMWKQKKDFIKKVLKSTMQELIEFRALFKNDLSVEGSKIIGNISRTLQ